MSEHAQIAIPIMPPYRKAAQIAPSSPFPASSVPPAPASSWISKTMRFSALVSPSSLSERSETSSASSNGAGRSNSQPNLMQAQPLPPPTPMRTRRVSSMMSPKSPRRTIFPGLSPRASVAATAPVAEIEHVCTVPDLSRPAGAGASAGVGVGVDTGAAQQNGANLDHNNGRTEQRRRATRSSMPNIGQRIPLTCTIDPLISEPNRSLTTLNEEQYPAKKMLKYVEKSGINQQSQSIVTTTAESGGMQSTEMRAHDVGNPAASVSTQTSTPPSSSSSASASSDRRVWQAGEGSSQPPHTEVSTISSPAGFTSPAQVQGRTTMSTRKSTGMSGSTNQLPPRPPTTPSTPSSPRRRSIIAPIDNNQFYKSMGIVMDPPKGSTDKSPGSESASPATQGTKPKLVSILRRPRIGKARTALAATAEVAKHTTAAGMSTVRSATSTSTPRVAMPNQSELHIPPTKNFHAEPKLRPFDAALRWFTPFGRTAPFPMDYVPPVPKGAPLQRSVSEPPIRSFKSVSFDPRVWVREFERGQEEKEVTWYTCADLETFQRRALALLMAREKMAQTEYLATGTGRVVTRRPAGAKCSPAKLGSLFGPQQNPNRARGKLQFTHFALRLDEAEDEMTAERALHSNEHFQLVLRQEIRNILLVDPHDICLTLFAKALQVLLPHVNFAMARSGEDALRHLGTGKRFDMILVEERLKTTFHRKRSGSITASPNDSIHGDHDNHSVRGEQLYSPDDHDGDQDDAKEADPPVQHEGGSWKFVSGAALIQTISKLGFVDDGIIFIGTSTHLQEDRAKLLRSGVDFVWNKPPPRMDASLRGELLRQLLVKRQKLDVVADLFGSSSPGGNNGD